jgi:hypothetical protein
MRRQRIQLRETTALNSASHRLLGQALQRYFCQYLINQRHLSPRTVAAYRDTFRLLLAFIEQCRDVAPLRLKPWNWNGCSVAVAFAKLARSLSCSSSCMASLRKSTPSSLSVTSCATY